MYNQIRYMSSWISVKLSKRLGQRGAEMIEYAVVLACIAAISVAFYKAAAGKNNGDAHRATLNGVLTDSWNSIYDVVDRILK